MSYSVRRHAARARVGVEQQPGRARVAVAGLADAAGVQQPLARARGRHVAAPARARRWRPRPRGGRRTARRASGRRRPTRSARVEAQLGQQRAEHVLPDRVARAGVVEAERAPRVGRAPGPQPPEVLGGEDLLGPAGGQRGAARELVERELAGHGQVVVAGQADVRVLAHERDSSRWGRRRSRRRRPGTTSRAASVRSTSSRTASRA